MTPARIPRLWRTILLTITISSLTLPAYAQYSGGMGVPDDPYQIATAEDLMLLGESPEDYDKHFILIADIDLDPNLPGGKVFDRAVIAPAESVTAWGSSYVETPFTGVFDGDGHTISHLKINGAGYLGLFGQLGDWGKSGEVKCLGMVDVAIVGSGGPVGGLVGVIASSLNTLGSIVTDCYSAGTVEGFEGDVGGLVGVNCGNIIRCYTAGLVKGNRHVGGLVGRNYHQYEASMSHIRYSYSTCVVNGGSAGGLVGENDGVLTCCYSSGMVTGGDAGGLIGGNDDGYVAHCYSTGAVIRTSELASVGGLMGYSYGGTVTQCFWDTQTSGQAVSAGGAGRTTAVMKSIETFLDAGWDFVGEAENGLNEVWQAPEDGGYPVLSIFHGYTQHQLNGLGTIHDRRSL